MNLPPDFTTYTRQWMGERLFHDYCTALDETPPVSVRLNPWKWTGPLAEGLSAGPVPWCREGVYLTRRPNFTFDPLLHAGAYYVQEASSMFLAHVLRQYVDHPVKMLDLCAAPGGKSITALTALPEGSLLFSNEPIRTRACILAENLMKLGCPDVVVTQNYPADYHKSGLQFDVVLTDAPCSGEGMFRKDPKAIEEWTPGHVENCRRLQREIVGEAWQCLRPGGLLVYSTCTLNRKENEDNVAWMEEELGARLLPVDTKEEWGITGSLAADWQRPVYRFLPARAKGEGMFFAVMRKPGADQLPCSLPQEKEKTKNKKKNRQDSRTGTPALPCPILQPDDYCQRDMGQLTAAIPTRWVQALDEARALKVLHAGIALGCRKGKDFVPDQGLALSTQLDRQQTACAELSRQAAVAYLQKSTALTLPPDTPRGLVLLTCQGHALGWAKHLGNRTNNLYPAEWKIKSSHCPDDDGGLLALPKE